MKPELSLTSMMRGAKVVFRLPRLQSAGPEPLTGPSAGIELRGLAIHSRVKTVGHCNPRTL